MCRYSASLYLDAHVRACILYMWARYEPLKSITLIIPESIKAFTDRTCKSDFRNEITEINPEMELFAFPQVFFNYDFSS